jgi:hypothetical protein
VRQAEFPGAWLTPQCSRTEFPGRSVVAESPPSEGPVREHRHQNRVQGADRICVVEPECERNRLEGDCTAAQEGAGSATLRRGYTASLAGAVVQQFASPFRSSTSLTRESGERCAAHNTNAQNRHGHEHTRNSSV